MKVTSLDEAQRELWASHFHTLGGLPGWMIDRNHQHWHREVAEAGLMVEMEWGDDDVLRWHWTCHTPNGVGDLTLVFQGIADLPRQAMRAAEHAAGAA